MFQGDTENRLLFFKFFFPSFSQHFFFLSTQPTQQAGEPRDREREIQ
jgi:hypothetical protein